VSVETCSRDPPETRRRFSVSSRSVRRIPDPRRARQTCLQHARLSRGPRGTKPTVTESSCGTKRWERPPESRPPETRYRVPRRLGNDLSLISALGGSPCTSAARARTRVWRTTRGPPQGKRTHAHATRPTPSQERTATRRRTPFRSANAVRRDVARPNYARACRPRDTELFGKRRADPPRSSSSFEMRAVTNVRNELAKTKRRTSHVRPFLFTRGYFLLRTNDLRFAYVLITFQIPSTIQWRPQIIFVVVDVKLQ